MASTSVRLSDFVYRRLEAVAEASGLSIDAIMTAACIEWMDRHFPLPAGQGAAPAEAGAADSQPEPFERFTSSARKVLERAPRLASETGARQIGVEHVAVALLDVQEGLAACALWRLGVDRPALVGALGLVEDVARDSQRREVLGPSDSVKQVIEIAFASSARLARATGQAELLGSDHLLLGVLMTDDDRAAQALGRLGVTEQAVRQAVEHCRQAGAADIA